MTGNMGSEVQRSIDVTKFGLDKVQKLMPPDPFRSLDPPPGLDLASITADIMRDYTAATGPVTLPGEQGSNNWVVDGTMTDTGKPLLANDPHRPVQIPSLRKTVHLVAPGWNVIGAGEPALPGIALGHNENIAFGFTIVGIDQQDLYVEKLNPENPNEYLYKGEWKPMEVEHQEIAVKGGKPETVELRYTMHGPMIYEDSAAPSRLCSALGGQRSRAGRAIWPRLSMARASNWRSSARRSLATRCPSENLVYADTSGNIGWIAAGLAPVRKNWSGLFPVPGDTGEYEWSGFLHVDDLPQSLQSASAISSPPRTTTSCRKATVSSSPMNGRRPTATTASSRCCPRGKKFDVADFEQMQQDVTLAERAALHAPPGPGFSSGGLGWPAAGRFARRPAL